MAAYQLITPLASSNAQPAMILRTADGAFIPNSMGNSDWLAFLAWEAAGGVPDQPPVQPTPALTPAMVLSRMTLAEFTAVMKTWVAAGAITQARSTTILTP